MTLSGRDASNNSKAAFAYCAEQVRTHDQDRYLCSQFAQSQRRSALWALYALNLELARTHEVVSQPMLGEVRRQWWRETLEGLSRGELTRHPVAEALAQSWPSRGQEQNFFLSLVDSRITDLTGQGPKTLEELELYLGRTSGSLMQLSLSALGVNDEAARTAGGGIGLAWGLVGLIRSLPFSSSPAQLCVPDRILSELGCSPGEELAGPSPTLTRAVKVLVERAMAHLCNARGPALSAPKAARAALSLGALARLYLDRLAKADCDPYVADLNVSSLRRLVKLGISWR